MTQEPEDKAGPSRVSIEKIVAYLNLKKPERVRELIARRLAIGVFKGNASEVLYWALVHHRVMANQREDDLTASAIATLGLLIGADS